VDGRRVVEPARRLVVALNKPVGYITTRADPRGRPTVYDLIADLGEWVFPVGRLDSDSSGLLILTNDHRLGQALTDPERHVLKVYHARVRGIPERWAIETLCQGVTLDDWTTRPARVRLLGTLPDGCSWIEIALSEGKNRQVRRMCAAVGHEVLDLTRVTIGRLALGDLPVGEWRRLDSREMELLSWSRD
jgi:23S rRNA pseudouridine2605 synthase